MLPVIAAIAFSTSEKPAMNVLVFSKTGGFRHDSIEVGQQTLKELATQHGFSVTTTEDAADFRPYNLDKYQAVVFLNTTGDILNDSEQKAFEDFISRGGGYVGVHAASDTEYDWPFYGKLVGAYFLSHPQIQEATIVNEAPNDSLMEMWPKEFKRTDEWYDFRANPRENVTVLASIKPNSHTGSKMEGDHPTIWCHEMGKGRAFYTGFGHTKETYAEKPFREMLYRALLWVTRN